MGGGGGLIATIKHGNPSRKGVLGMRIVPSLLRVKCVFISLRGESKVLDKSCLPTCKLSVYSAASVHATIP